MGNIFDELVEQKIKYLKEQGIEDSDLELARNQYYENMDR
jgi:hypothetical protein